MKKRLKFKSKVAVLTAFIMLSLVGRQNFSNVLASETYGKAYTIGNILSDYQYFVQGDLTATSVGHCEGAVAVGGTLASDNTVGGAQVAASYVKNLKKLTDFPLGKDIEQTSYGSYKIDKFYYDCLDKSFLSNGQDWLIKRLTKNPGYIDFNTAFDKLKKESSYLANTGSPSYTLKDSVLTININNTTDNYITIPYSKFNAASNIVIAGITSVQDFVNHKYIISVTGVNSTNFTLSCYKMRLNKIQLSQIMTNLSGGTKGSQINLEGMKLIWNFPDATRNLTADGLSGHLVAPQANVILTGGNFDGGIIAKNVSKADAEGHYYPFNTPDAPPEEPDRPTFTPTNVPTSMPTHVPTFKPTNTPAPLPTNTPAPIPTGIFIPTSTPAPVIQPSNSPSPTPYKQITVIKVLYPTNTPIPTSTPAPTIMPVITTAAAISQTPPKALDADAEDKWLEFEMEDENDEIASVETTPAIIKKSNTTSNTFNSNKSDSSSSPKTGEHTPLMIFIIIALASGIGLIIFKLIKKIS